MEGNSRGYISFCERCGIESYETFGSHSSCSACNYSPAFDQGYVQFPDWALQFISDEMKEDRAKLEKRKKKRAVTEHVALTRNLALDGGTDA